MEFLHSFFLTEQEISQLTWEYPSAGSVILFFLGTCFFLFLNAFFVANEFASARVRESQLAENDDDTKAKARRRRRALHIVRHLDTFLSANQVGITLASLALGGLSEPFIESLIAPPLEFYCHLAPAVVSAISYTVAYALFTFAHVVLGELVPKSLAIRHPLEVSMATATGMTRFAHSTRWIVNLFNNTANAIAHRLFGIDPHYEPTSHHSAEEIALIVEQSGRSNEVTETEAEISKNALELNDRSVRDIVVPRSSVEVIDITASFEQILDAVNDSRHSRFPLVQGSLDKVKGWVHVKDILKLVRTGRADLTTVMRPLKIVPETMKLDTLLNFFSKENTHFALAVDEYGDAIGMVFLDDVLEEIVGNDIRDEFEEATVRDFFTIAPGQHIASGALALFDLEEYLPQLGELESENGVSTLGGYITDLIGHLPEPGEQVRVKDFIATVTGSDGRRITQLRLEHCPRQENDPEEDDEEDSDV